MEEVKKLIIAIHTHYQTDQLQKQAENMILSYLPETMSCLLVKCETVSYLPETVSCLPETVSCLLVKREV